MLKVLVFVALISFSCANLLRSVEQRQSFVDLINAWRQATTPSSDIGDIVLDSEFTALAEEWGQLCIIAAHPKMRLLYGLAWTTSTSDLSADTVVQIYKDEWEEHVMEYVAHEISSAKNASALLYENVTKVGVAKTQCGLLTFVTFVFDRKLLPGRLPFVSTCVPNVEFNESDPGCGDGFNDGCVIHPQPPCDGFDFGNGTIEPFVPGNELLLPGKVSRRAVFGKRDYYDSYMDYRWWGVVTGTKNQGQCGSCAAFTAVEVMETTWALRRGGLYTMSLQYCLDCGYWRGVCQTGSGSDWWFYMSYYKPFILESQYPYLAYEAGCRWGAGGYFSGNGVYGIPARWDYMHSYIRQFYPLSIYMMVEGPFYSYAGGLFASGCASRGTNHAMSIMGYGYDEYGRPYWLVRNHWGSWWGEGGYLRYYKGINLCQIEQYPMTWLPR